MYILSSYLWTQVSPSLGGVKVWHDYFKLNFGSVSVNYVTQ